MMIATMVALMAVGCGDDDVTPGTDGGMTGTDSGMTDTDSGMTDTDSGMMTTDPCAASDANAVSTVGCNGGFVSGEPVANGPLGECTPGGEAMPAGTCTTPNTVCAAGEGETTGECVSVCAPASTYVSTGVCPTGFRCFTLSAEVGICFRDCDATNACPTGMECDSEGSCVPADDEEEEEEEEEEGEDDADPAA
ncbi:MAG: hypothetical protein KF901_08955 [Myxococcales bacterium]|nr:hypothetical protein [Myxococcales bacterium]